VGITEHMPPVHEAAVYPDERKAGLGAEALRARFHRYFETARKLQARYRDTLEILVGFETETYSGSGAFVKEIYFE